MKVTIELGKRSFIGRSAGSFSNGALLEDEDGRQFLKLHEGLVNLTNLMYHKSEAFGRVFQEVPYDKLILER